MATLSGPKPRQTQEDLPVRFQKKSLNDKSKSKSWRLDFKKYSKQKRKTQQVSQDSGLENISTEKNKYQRTRKLYCMSNEDITSLAWLLVCEKKEFVNFLT